VTVSVRRLVPLAPCLLLWLASTACQAKRTLVVTSAPEGAQVRLDGRNIGETPVTLKFEHYGTRRVTLYLDGYLTYSRVLEMHPPWYGRFPLDLFSEVLVPVGWQDEHKLHATLELGESVIQAPALESVIERSEELRRAGPEGPVPVVRPLPEPSEPIEEDGGS